MAAGSQRVAEALDGQRRDLLVTAARIQRAGVRDVHRSRVAARRLRSLLATFRPLLDAERVRALRTDLRRYGHALATVREADVRRVLLMEVVRSDGSIPAAESRRMAAVLDAARREARARLRRQLAAPGWAALGGTLVAGLDPDALLASRDAGTAAVLRRVDRTWREAVRLLEQRPRKARELHELRLSLKHCRYALEAVPDVAPAETARLLKRLRGAQDAIGEHRDGELAAGWVRANAPRLGRPLSKRLLGSLAGRERSLRRAAAESSERLLPAYRQWRAATRPLSRGSRQDPA
jgi:CHAD domain-containing protein